ncbi:hypothetical protein FA13DRAFT_1742160 [Coprinellus micaceus]|uniref:Uncharacterized protein n=1 Tax=Coprinellus micaceus TaxID=71717 RepID=A0A4Y7SHJ9_COPMI|nr:hypothetical protein FA13DRAFT_1742160 [Coprinellus micaceus]
MNGRNLRVLSECVPTRDISSRPVDTSCFAHPPTIKTIVRCIVELQGQDASEILTLFIP